MRWNIESIIEALCLSDFNETFTNMKNDLDRLRGYRNHILHGEMETVSFGDARQCLEVAQKLLTIYRSERFFSLQAT